MELPPLVPQHFLCPISLELMSDPVILSTGITYDRFNIQKWLNSGHNTCPVTNQVLPSKDLLSNLVLQRLINTWRFNNHCGTPFPLNSSAHSSLPDPELVSEILRNIDGSRPIEAFARLKALAQENNQNKEMISSSRGPRILTSVLCRLSLYGMKNWSSEDAEVYREALGALCSLSLDDDAKGALVHTKALSPAIESLREGDLQLKVSFLKLLRDLSKEKRFRVRLGATQELLGRLLDLLRSHNVHPSVIEMSLATLSALCEEKQVRDAMVRWGIMETLIDLLARVEGEVCEKSLVLVETLLESPAGWRAGAKKHASSMITAVTSSIVRGSEAGTECGVRILCKLCMSDKKSCQQAVSKGAIVKAVLVLQMSDHGTKRRAAAMQLLKLLHHVDTGSSTAGKKHLHCCHETSRFDVLHISA